MKSLARALLDSKRAASLRGPTTFSPRLSNVSTSPAARGASGPTIVKSIFDASANDASAAPSLTLIDTHSAICAMPALPGAQNSCKRSLDVRCNAQQIACSLPPDPITRIFMFFLETRRAVSGCDHTLDAESTHQIFSAKMLDSAGS